MKITIIGLILIGGIVSGCIDLASDPETYTEVTTHNQIILFPDTGKFVANQTVDHEWHTFNGDYKIIGNTLYLNNMFGTDMITIVNDSALQYKNELYLKN